MSLELGAAEYESPPTSPFGAGPNEDSPDDTDSGQGSYQTNVPALTRRLALRFADQGFQHPVAAAVAVTLRGLAGAELAAFSGMVGVDAGDLGAIEAGNIELDDLPQELTSRMAHAGLDPDTLGDLSRQLRTT